MTGSMKDLFGDTPLVLPPEGVPTDVCKLFEDISLRVHGMGYERFSSDAILHKIRWEMKIERGNRTFKCNDHWTAPLARWLIAKHPKMKDFFELRKSPHQEEAA